MPKLKEFFLKLKEQGRIKNEAWDKFVESVPEGEITDDVIKAFEDSFLTVDRASSHAAVNGTIRAQILSPIDNDIKKIISIVEGIDKDAAAEIEAAMINRDTPNTFKRMELITRTLPAMIEKMKTASHAGDDDIKKKLSEKDSIIKEMTDRVTKVQKESESKQAELEGNYNKKIGDYVLRSELEKLGSNFTLAEGYEKNRSNVTKLVMSELLTSNHIKLGEKDGAYVIEVTDDKGGPRFDGNTQVTINSLLETYYKPYLKQSNADGGGDGGQANPRTFTVPGQPKTTKQPRTTAVTISH